MSSDKKMRRFNGVLVASLAMTFAGGLWARAKKTHDESAGTATQEADAKEWPTYGHDSGAMRYSPLTQINTKNANELSVAWVYHMKPEGFVAPVGRGRGGRGGPGGRGGAGGFGGAGQPGGPDEPAAPGAASGRGGDAVAAQAAQEGFRGFGRGGTGFLTSEDTPLVVNGVMYIGTPYGRVAALDPTTGKEIWTYKLPAGEPATRGVEYFPGDKQTPPEIVVGTSDAKLFTLDAETGEINKAFGVDGIVDLNTPEITHNLPNASDGLSSPPVMFENLIIVGGRTTEGGGPGPAGDVRAFDVHNGKLVWTFHSIPQPGEPNYGTWAGDSAKDRSGVNVWGLMTVDSKRGIVYLPFGAPSGDAFGGDRPGDNLYGSSIVAVNARTGKYIWHFQLVHHDIWDFDAETPPVLMDVKHNGKVIPAVAVIAKDSLLYLLDRTNGKPIYGVEERPVPQSDVPLEKTSPTQPFPVKPPPLARQTMTMDDIATVTPELEAACKKLVEDNHLQLGGPFLPITYGHVRVNFPSEIGGVNWPGGAFNPALGYFFINVMDLGQMQGYTDPRSGPLSPNVVGTNQLPGRNGTYSSLPPGGRFKDNALDMPCSQPPWGELVAVNVNTGDIAWKVPLGITESLPPDKQNTGRPGMGGPIATAGGLVFVGATDDNRFRAFDAKTGKELWSYKLDAAAGSVPSTYQGKDGRQYVVVTSAGNPFAAEPATSDAITAFALPKK
ncbi:MAG TPA: pyrroloquinoline quinone-dependent dehydrogenase [Candidatus Acidoferrales bacterium]|nr:pyrroloquinoline quinone-dependent dehydrogenase [Candidatus Acidoferrales bacterium]